MRSTIEVLGMQAAVAMAVAQEGVDDGEWSQDEADNYIKQELTELAARKGLTFEDVLAELERVEAIDNDLNPSDN